MRSRVLVVLLAVVLVVGVFPPARAQAFAPPVPVAPPITGLCATPWGAVACITAGIGAAIGEALVWWESVQLGFAPTPDGWCMTDTGHMFQEGSIDCTTPTINTSPELEDMVRDQFEGVPEPAFDPHGDYLWHLAPAQDQCIMADGEEWCFNFARTRQVDGGVEVNIGYQPGANACPNTSGTFSGLGTGSNQGRLPVTATDALDSAAPCLIVLGNFIGPGGMTGASRKVLVGRAREDGGNQNTGDNFGSYTIGGAGEHYSWASHNLSDVKMDNPEAPGTLLIFKFEGNRDGFEVARWNLARDPNQFEGEYQTTTACRDGAGNITIRTSTSLDSFVIGAASGTLPQAGCLPGEFPVSTKVELCDVNGTTCIEVADWVAAPDLSPSELTCLAAMSGPEPCPMWLEVWTGSEWEICEPAVAGLCTNWWTNPARDINFRCGWGGNYYTASQCEVLKTWYNVENPDPETDLQPVNPRDPDRDPGVDAPTVTPDPETGALPGTISGPSTPPSARPTAPWLQRIITEWSTGSTANLQNSCWPQGWGLLNPLQWVMRPIMCALTFLFVPTTPVQTQLDQLWTEARATTRLGTVLDAGDLLTDIPSLTVGSACGWGIPPIETPQFTTPEVQLIMCPSDFNMAGTASTVRSWGFAVLGVWVIGMAFRWLELGRPEDAPDEGTDGGML